MGRICDAHWGFIESLIPELLEFAPKGEAILGVLEKLGMIIWVDHYLDFFFKGSDSVSNFVQVVNMIFEEEGLSNCLAINSIE